ncbi:hypothetical protein B0T25DRAFT_628279 [Lasiosphaeria hispida]|uniref:Uncharacterized protein n=1 Tax=Lasiosphaeria hispida TaxID=260671 RepID=A0AAJ0HXL8_9PEZI|nr:hypothetical protein B0T25DRAFT_628279 [Lasiosphaeria hispida]
MLARTNKIKSPKGAEAENVAFFKGATTAMPPAAEVADYVISNCVINPVPAAKKALVFREIDAKGDLNIYLGTAEGGTKKTDCCAPPAAGGGGGCIGAQITCCSTAPAGVLEETNLNEWVGSYKVYAVKK